MNKNNYIAIAFISFIFFNLSCREEIALETQSFESSLVVEATITNELKHQEIKVSRTFILEASQPTIENNAEVRVIDNNGNSFNFSQNSEGVYLSDNAFQAIPNVKYTLLINTVDGKTYNSNTQTLTPISQISNLYAEYLDDAKKGPGVQIFVDSENDNSEVKYFRYEFEETIKIVAPFYYYKEALLSNYFYDSVTSSSYFDYEIVPRTQEEQVCFNTFSNTEIIQTNTSNLYQNNVLRFPIRFIPDKENREPIGVVIEEYARIKNISALRDRYSIKVTQYVQNLESFTYYNNISTLGDNENILSENQPGYVVGNITSASNDRVIGYFEVSSVVSERIYLDYTDFNLPQPEYIYNCDYREYDYADNSTMDGDDERSEIYRLVDGFKEINMNYQITITPFTTTWQIANPECTDCTNVGSNIQPDFWLD